MEYRVVAVPEKSPLTKRENELLCLAAEGKVRWMMCHILHRAKGTIDAHMLHIFQKMGVDNVQQAIAVGFAKGILVAKDLLLLVLTVTTTITAIIPDQAYANRLIKVGLQYESVVDGATSPFLRITPSRIKPVRVRVRGGGRGGTRRRED